MNIQDKIEEIRKKPEHIRVRYTWILTGISMVFVIAIWIISFSVQNKEEKSSSQNPNQAGIFDELKEQKESLKDATGQMKDAMNQAKNLQNQSNSDNNQGTNPGQPGEGFNR